MAIKKVTAYVAQCDICKSFYPGPDGQGAMHFSSKEQAKKELKETGLWKMKNGKMACEQMYCHEQL